MLGYGGLPAELHEHGLRFFNIVCHIHLRPEGAEALLQHKRIAEIIAYPFKKGGVGIAYPWKRKRYKHRFWLRHLVHKRYVAKRLVIAKLYSG